jgi:hypothetical protein
LLVNDIDADATSGISVRYWSIPSTGIVPVSAFLIIPVQDWPDAGHYIIHAIRKPFTVESDTPCTPI